MRISWYELGVYELVVVIVRLIVDVFGVLFLYFYCEDDEVVELFEVLY